MTPKGSLTVGRSSPPSSLKSNNSGNGFNATSITVLSCCLRRASLFGSGLGENPDYNR